MQYSVYESIAKNNRFPVNAFVISLDNVSWHWHNEYEFIGVLRGCMKFQVQSEEYILKTGDMVLVNSREIHKLEKYRDNIESEDQKECLCMIVQIAADYFTLEEEEEENREIHFYVNSTEEEEPRCGYGLLYYRMAKILYETLVETKVSPYRIRAMVCSLIADLMEFSIYDIRRKPKGDYDQQNILITLIEYIEKHMMSETILEDVCHEFGVSRKTLDRLSDGVLGISMKELLNSLRIEKAKKLLRYSNKSISNILEVCGYNSENTFYRVFKADVGLTPKEFRDATNYKNDKDELKGYLDYETYSVISKLKEITDEWENRNYR